LGEGGENELREVVSFSEAYQPTGGMMVEVLCSNILYFATGEIA